MHGADPKEVAVKYIIDRFKAGDVVVERVYELGNVVEIAGRAVIGGRERRFTVLVEREKGEVRGYGLR